MSNCCIKPRYLLVSLNPGVHIDTGHGLHYFRMRCNSGGSHPHGGNSPFKTVFSWIAFNAASKEMIEHSLISRRGATCLDRVHREESTGIISVSTGQVLHFHMSMLELLISFFFKAKQGSPSIHETPRYLICFLEDVWNHFIINLAIRKQLQNIAC